MPVIYWEESWTKNRTREVTAGSKVPNVCRGTIFRATLFSQLFCSKPSVISDLKSPGDIAFTLTLYIPNSMAMTCVVHIWKTKTNFVVTIYNLHNLGIGKKKKKIIDNDIAKNLLGQFWRFIICLFFGFTFWFLFLKLEIIQK